MSIFKTRIFFVFYLKFTISKAISKYADGITTLEEDMKDVNNPVLKLKKT